MLKTLIVHNRYAWHFQRTAAALKNKQGVMLLTIEQLAARLAGGFLQSINPDDSKIAVASAVSESLGELDTIKTLPGFQRAVSATLEKSWMAGLNLSEEAEAATDQNIKSRLLSLATLEKAVIAKLPLNQLCPKDLATAALKRIYFAKAIFGRIEIHGRTEMSPVWRPLLFALSQQTEVIWVAKARKTPDWLASGSGIALEATPLQTPDIKAISCASPRHEVLEALRWARKQLVSGIAPQDIAIATASPQAWDDHMLALAESANLPLHFIHGHAALSTSEGQLCAALAEILLRGFSRMRVVRLVALLRTCNPDFESLPGNWWRLLPEDAPLLDAAHWKQALSLLFPEKFTDKIDHRPTLNNVIEALNKGLHAAREIGESLLKRRALVIWHKALIEGPPAALDVTLTGLRVDDGVNPETAIVWGPASAIAANPRPFTWLIGLTSQSWPRRANEDPLLPDHIIASDRLDPLPIHQADRRDFRTIADMTSHELVCSRARNNSEGRHNGISPLFPRNVDEIYLAQSREPEHAVSASDRLLARHHEFARLPLAASAQQTWIDWHTEEVTRHDGWVRAQHPLLLQALARRQSSSSLVRLLCDPLGYLWIYGFGWKAPEETDEPLTLDALAFGNLLHEILEEAVTQLERTVSGGFASASREVIARAVEAAGNIIAQKWEENCPIPPPVVWNRKHKEAVDLALAAMSYNEGTLSGQKSWAEIPFGGDRKAQALSEEECAQLPWNPMAPVVIPGTNIHIGGSIDRLDLAGDNSSARVTDYKSGKPPGKPPQLKGGTELQRCLYAYAVKALISTHPQVDTRLLYLRNGGKLLPLDDPEGTLEKLAGYLSAAAQLFSEGNALPGPASADEWYDLAFALPGGAKESYLSAKLPLAYQELASLEPLWREL